MCVIRSPRTPVTNIVYVFYFLCHSNIVVAPSPARVSQCMFSPNLIM